MLRITARILTGLAVISLSGCAVPIAVSMGLGIGSVAVNETTGRTATDHVVSAVNGRDCRVSRMGREDVCQDDLPKLTITTTGVKPTSVADLERRYQ